MSQAKSSSTSKRTPNSAIAKIALALSQYRAISVLLIALMVLLGVWLYGSARSAQDRVLHVGNHNYTLEVAITKAAQEEGLGDRASMPANHGMLFVFQRETKQCFWMKHMHFPLDIIWTDANHKVVFLETDLSPDTYPQTFCSSQSAAYAIEVPVGTVQKTGIHLGQVLTF